MYLSQLPAGHFRPNLQLWPECLLRSSQSIREIKDAPIQNNRLDQGPVSQKSRKAISETANRLFWKADLLTCFKLTKRNKSVKFDDLNPLRS